MNFKTKFLLLPKPLYRHAAEGGLERIGFIWWKRVQLINNVNLGWIALLDSTAFTCKCPTCGKDGYQP